MNYIDRVTLPDGGLYYYMDALARTVFPSIMQPYNPSTVYKYDNYVFKEADSKVYRCVYNMTNAEAWNSSHWEEVTLTNELSKIKDALYQPIVINTLTASPASAEKGSTVTSVTLSYAMNKAAQSMILDSVPISNTTQSGTIAQTGSWTTTKTWTLTATDEKGYTCAAKTVSLSFLNNVIYGVAAMPSTINSAFVNGLATKTLSSTRKRTISVNAGSGQLIWYCVPTGLGACTFSVGGFTGGFSNRVTVSVTNSSGYSENYYVYYSDNAGLGSTSVVIT